MRTSPLLPFVMAVTVVIALLSLAAIPSGCLAVATPRTSRRYTLLVEELTKGLDEEGTRPTLVSVAEDVSLTLPAASAAAVAAWEGDAEAAEIDAAVAAHLTFDEDFDPIWYFVLRRRGFEHLDWSGCGGKWRPEWSIPKGSTGAGDASDKTQLFDQLHHYLAHHAVCTYSSVSFCGASHERDASSQFQWAAQFVSTLTSTPLSWTSASPHHTRPNGILLTGAAPNTSGGAASSSSAADDGYWCSYHLVYHDTLCTQHVSPLLNGGRSGRGVQEGLPHGIFKAVFPSFVHFFGSPFHHFSVKASQVRRPPANASEAGSTAEVQLTVQMRMTMVARERSELAALAEVWERELPAYAADGRLEVHVGPGGLAKRLRTALPAAAIVTDAATPTAPAAEVSPSGVVASVGGGWSPEVKYEVYSHGKDHGYLTVELQPALATLDAQVSGQVTAGDEEEEEEEEEAGEGEGGHKAHAGAGSRRRPSATAAAGSHSFRLQEGDVVRTLLLLPLHLARPSLYNMESLLGATRVVQAHTDVSSNTLAVLLETPMTAAHVAAYEATYAEARQRLRRGTAHPGSDRRRGAPQGVMLGRFPLFFGWTALHEMPPDDNSNRLLPQPVVVITRSGADDGFCAAQRRAGGLSGVPPLDHIHSLATIFQLLNGTFVWRDGKAASAGPHDHHHHPQQGQYSNALLPSQGRSGNAAAAASAAGAPCVYWVRSTVASGTTIPGPDGAMVFNVLSLGLVFSAVGAGILTRLTRRMTLRKESLAMLLEQEK